VRVMASTNRDLPAEIAAGRFREDLYYRLAVVPLEMPPLRQRDNDVQLLADFFLERAARKLGRERTALSADCRELLSAYHWPGNVRELENLITRACVLNAGEAITADQIRPWLQEPERVAAGEDTKPQAVSGSLDEIERATIIATLERFGGNRGQTAAALGIGVRTLSGKLRAWGFAPRTKEFSVRMPTVRQELPAASAGTAVGALRRTA
jgi:DNA-binding NtrC family response regulator